MRFPQVVLATAIAAPVLCGLACDKGPPLSTGTPSLTPAGVTTTAASSAVTPLDAERAPAAPRATADAPQAHARPADPSTGTSSTAADPGHVDPANVAERNLAEGNLAERNLAEGNLAEGNGEPMDDVDDDEVSASDRSGVDDDPSAPIDESEGADIDLRE